VWLAYTPDRIRGRTDTVEDYAKDSIVADFLHEEELDDLIAGFEQAGIYCEVVQDEEGFQGRASHFENFSITIPFGLR
jgi:hypothetical protein